MVENQKPPRLVGNFIRQRREALGLSQRALGLLFDPPVTTQFISNVERGVTPLPPNHISTLTKALLVSEEEIKALLEREYAMKLSGKLGKNELGAPQADQLPDGVPPHLVVTREDYHFMRALYDAYRLTDPKTQQAFATVCESMLNMVRSRKNTAQEAVPENATSEAES